MAPAQTLPRIEFPNSGWCEKLQKSYTRGKYQPKDKEELESLKEFGKVVYPEGAPECGEKALVDMNVTELRKKASELQIPKYSKMGKDELLEEIGKAQEATNEESEEGAPEGGEETESGTDPLADQEDAITGAVEGASE